MSMVKQRGGQTSLIAVLVAFVGLSIVVAVASRSVTTVSISTQEEERSRSFSAAEAGIEDALRKDLSSLAGTALPTLTIGDSTVQVAVTKLPTIEADVDPGEVVTVDWEASDAATTMFSVQWAGQGCSPTMVATEISSLPGVGHVVDPTSPAQFSRAPTSRLVRMRFVGCPAAVTMTGTGGALSFFGIDSVGSSGDAKSRVQVLRSALSPIGLMDFAVFSGSDIQ